MADDGIVSTLKELGTKHDVQKIKEFFDTDAEGPWMHWLFLESKRAFLYLDNYDNFEFYGQVVADIPEEVWKRKGRRRMKQIEVQVKDSDWHNLEKMRMCVYSSNMHPNADMLHAMAHQKSTDCDVIDQLIKSKDIFGGVHVEVYTTPGGNFVVDKFLEYTPMSDSKWMVWASIPNNFIYHDADNNTEIYTKADVVIPGLPQSDDTIYVKLKHDVDMVALRVARARLYQQTNDLHATQEQLDDMVELIKKNPPGPDLKRWGDDLYKREAKADKEGWTFRPQSGLVPLKAQFYFNPKPLKKGDQSEYDKGNRMDHTTLAGLAESSEWDKSWS